MLKRIVIVLSLFAMLLTLPIVANAEEWGALEGESHSYRWGITGVDAITGKTYLYLPITDDLLNQNDTLAAQVLDFYNDPNYENADPSAAIQDWYTSTSGKVRFVDTDFSTSKVDIIHAAVDLNWNGSINARTFLKNSSNQWSSTDAYYSPGGFNSGTAVYGAIIFNYDLDSFEYDRQAAYVLKHEMGHILGLGHTNTFYSIMKEPYTESIVNIQAYDVAVLNQFYPNIQ